MPINSPFPATSQGRVIMTFNVKDYVSLGSGDAVTARPHSGIVVSDHLPFRELLKRTLLLLQRHANQDVTNRLFWLKITKPMTYPLERTCFNEMFNPGKNSRSGTGSAAIASFNTDTISCPLRDSLTADEIPH